MVRDALQSEYQTLVDMANQYTSFKPNSYPGELENPSTAFTIDDISRFPDDAEGILLVKEVDGEIVGFIKGHVVEGLCGFMDIIFNNPYKTRQEKLTWIYEMSLALANRVKDRNASYMYGYASSIHPQIIQVFQDIQVNGSEEWDRKDFPSDWGGKSRAQDTVDNTILKCQQWLIDNGIIV